MKGMKNTSGASVRTLTLGQLWMNDKREHEEYRLLSDCHISDSNCKVYMVG